MIFNEKKYLFLLLPIIVFFVDLFFLFLPSVNAGVVTKNVSRTGVEGLASQNFSIAAGYTSVSIASGSVDDRGMVSINGSNILFQCSDWNGYLLAPFGCGNKYGDGGVYIVSSANAPSPITNSCNIANAISFPINITSLVYPGTNTLSANIDNCGEVTSGFNFDLQISYPSPSCTFSISPSSIVLGENATLSWSCSSVSSVIIDGASKSSVGNMIVSPATAGTFTYNLTATGLDETIVARSVVLNVNWPMPTCNLYFSMPTVYVGDYATINWTSTYAASGSINPMHGVINPLTLNSGFDPGLKQIAIGVFTYMMTIVGLNGSTTYCYANLTVTGPPPTCYLNSLPNPVSVGGSSTLSWGTTYTVSADINGVVVPGVSLPNGSKLVWPTADTTYTMNVLAGDGKTGSCNNLVKIASPSCDFTVTPSTINSGDSAQLDWSTSDASSAILNGGVFINYSVPAGEVLFGSRIVTPLDDTTYTFTATGPTGKTCTKSVTITINAPTCNLTATPVAINVGDSVVLNWSSSSALSATLDGGIFSGNVVPVAQVPLGNKTVYPTSDSTYTFVATGPTGKTCTKSVTITINAPTCNLALSSNPVAIGGSSTLSWTTISTSTAKINTIAVLATDLPNGSKSVTHTISTPLVTSIVYTMDVIGPAPGLKTGTCNITLNIIDPCLGVVCNTPGTCEKSAGTCDPLAGGICNYDPDTGASCPTGNLCAPTGTCSNLKVCVPGALKICNTPGQCGLPDGVCEPSTGNCIYSPNPGVSCESGNPCNPGVCDSSGTCVPGGNRCGGLVPCARLVDNPSTLEINETKPCDFCASLYMLKNIINFALELAINLAVFVIIIGGLLYAFSSGNPRWTELAKSAMSYALVGAILIFIAWLIIAIIFQAMGYSGIATWNQVNCVLQN